MGSGRYPGYPRPVVRWTSESFSISSPLSPSALGPAGLASVLYDDGVPGAPLLDVSRRTRRTVSYWAIRLVAGLGVLPKPRSVLAVGEAVWGRGQRAHGG